MARAQSALQSEGYSIDWSGSDARHGTKGPVSALILCETAPGGGVHYNLIIHTNGSRPAADEGAPLDNRMKNPPRGGTGGGGTSSGGAGGGSGKAVVNVALGRPAQQSSTFAWAGPATGPASGVDGKLGSPFHTDNEQSPWWQVDLGRSYALQEVRVFNRMDCCGERARSLMLLLSDDGRNWQNVYSNQGRDFGGKDNPLKINLAGRQARYVRIQLEQPNYLHLEEVEVYGVQYFDR